MTGIVDFAIGRARMVLAIFVCALGAGLLSFLTLPREADPDIPFPFVIVVVPLDGISPEDAERLIVRPTETEMRAIEGLQELNGTASLGAGSLIAEFDVPFDADQSVQDVREAVDMDVLRGAEAGRLTTRIDFSALLRGSPSERAKYYLDLRNAGAI